MRKAIELLKDVNLNSVCIEDDGRGVTLDFINMENGANAGRIKCFGVIALDYQNCFDEEDYEGFAAYVGSIFLKRISVEACEGWLKNKYRFTLEDPSEYMDLLVVHVLGGEVDLQVVCKIAHFNGLLVGI
ncbi:hypothetical protein [Chitiniphilus shinanonensis]|uniref:hypothetical protein n=1 Tax=Chitiniphilus shinanonensis TaxID=553088 RepID=UPI0030698C8B